MNNNFIINVDISLPSYDFNEGKWPDDVEQSEKTYENAVDRWYIDINDAKCKPFKYKGTSGNYNNFPSYNSCLNHCNL